MRGYSWSMDAWDDEPRVRPIPIEDDGSSEFESDADTGTRDGDQPSVRPWLPLTLAAVAVAIVLGSVASFGAFQDQDTPPANEALTESEPPEEEAPSQPTTVAASLQDTIPGVTDRLTLLANGPNGATALVWDPSFVEPKPLEVVTFGIVESPIDPTLRLRSATFDAGGDFVAVTGVPRDSATEVLRVGTPTDVSAVTIEGATSFAWHATDVAHLAWIELNAGGVPTLNTARVNPLSRVLMNQKEVAEVAAVGSRLVRWDEEGFLLNSGFGEIVALSPNGDELWRSLGRALTASASTIYTTTRDADPDRLASVRVLDRSGLEIDVLFDEGVDDELISRTVSTSGNTGLVARVDVRRDRTLIELEGPAFVGTRIIEYDDETQPIGFISNDNYFVLKAIGTNDLIFVNWWLGSIHVLTVPDQYGIVGFDFG